MKILVYTKSLLTFLFKVSNHSHFRYYFLIFSFYGILHGQVTPTTLSVVATGTNVSYQWYSNTLNSTSNASLIGSATSSSYTPPPFTGIRYYFVVVEDDCGAAITSTVVTVQISANHTWNGSQSTDWNTAANWTPEGVPLDIDHIYIPNCTNAPLKNNLTIACGGSVTLNARSKLTLNGIIDKNGTLTIKNGATLVQNGIGSNTGTGTYSVKQAISGSGGAAPNGRFWYLGSPLANSVSEVYHAQTQAVLKYFKEPIGDWVEIDNATTPIEVGKGYFVQTGAMNTIEFLDGPINNGSYLIACTRTGTTNYYRGFNLVSNPYASYVDFDAVTKTNVLATMWYRTADQMQTMVFDTYNSRSNIGTSVSGEAVTNFIAPMQSFWMKIPDGYTTGEIGFTNEMRSHHSTGFERLKNKTNNFPVYIRLKLIDEEKKDQMIVYMDNHVSGQIDEYDAEKMMVPDYPQLYTSIENLAFVINALPLSKSKTIVPVTVNLPNSKSYQLLLDEVNLENASLTLEDKQENIFQDLSINSCYTFCAEHGIINDRFVLHIKTFPTASFENNSNEEANLFEPVIIQYGLSGDLLIRLKEPIESECHLRIHDMSAKLVYSTTLKESETLLHVSEG